MLEVGTNCRDAPIIKREGEKEEQMWCINTLG